jgi:RNA polymerase sigma-70 factor (ECF subfamily)
MTQSEPTADDAESGLRSNWSIAPLRPWLLMIARQEIPDELRGQVEPSDIVQQALLDAWRGEANFRGSTHAQRLAWLRVILRRVILQSRRNLFATQKRGLGVQRTMVDAVANSSLRIEQLAVGKEPTADEAVDGDEQNLLVAAALERLPDDQRRVIEMRHFGHQSYNEIAAELDRSPPATRMLWVRALVQLRREITQLSDPPH